MAVSAFNASPSAQIVVVPDSIISVGPGWPQVSSPVRNLIKTNRRFVRRQIFRTLPILLNTLLLHCGRHLKLVNLLVSPVLSATRVPPAAVSDVVKRKAQGEGGAPGANKEESTTGRVKKPKSWDVVSRKGVPTKGVKGATRDAGRRTSSQVCGAPAIAGSIPVYLFNPCFPKGHARPLWLKHFRR
jgi:hypothetical protein